MADEKGKIRNPLGAIIPREVTRNRVVNGKPKPVKVTVYDARKRYVKPNGTRAEKNKRGRTQSEASTALVNFQKEIEQEFLEAAGKIEKQLNHTFFSLTQYFRQEYLIKAVIVRDRQVTGYRQNLSKLENMIKDFEAHFGDIPLQDFNYEMIRSYSIKLATEPRKSKYGPKDPPQQSTINRRLAFLRKLFNVAKQLKWLTTNPVNEGKSLILTSAENTRDRILSFEEEERLLAACTGDIIGEQTKKGGRKVKVNRGPVREFLIPILIMAIDTGMRRGEIFVIERGQIDFTNCTLSLRANQTKGLKARTMPMSDRLEKALRAHFEKRFVAKDQPVFEQKEFRKSWKSALDAAGIKGLNFHDLRHTATTWMDEAGVSEAVKKNIVGHSSDVVHQKYNNLSSDVLKNAKNKIDDFRANIIRGVFQTSGSG